MKYRLPCVCVCCLCLLGCLVMGGCTHSPASPREATTYRCELRTDPTQGLVGVQHVAYSLPAALDTIVLWVGNATVTETTWEGTSIPHAQQGVYCTLSLPALLPAGTRGDLTISFCCSHAPSGDVTADAIPWVCAYDGGYQCPPPVTFAPYAWVDGEGCTLLWRLPVTVTGAISGVRSDLCFANEGQILTYRLTPLGHNLLVTSPYYATRTQTVDEATVTVLTRDTANRLTDRVCTVVQRAQPLFGPCPALCVAQTDKNAVAVGLVCTDNTDRQTLTTQLLQQWLLPHVGHTDPWVLPSLSAFYTWYYYRTYDPNVADRLYQQARERVYQYRVLADGVHEKMRLDGAPQDYTPTAYSILLGDKGLLLWYTLYQLVGDKLTTVLPKTLADAPTQAVWQARLFDALGDYGYFFDAWLSDAVNIY